jgi:hypothetical protein
MLAHRAQKDSHQDAITLCTAIKELYERGDVI